MSELDSEVISGLLRHSLKAGKQPYVTVASNSMLPLLRRGDQIQLTDVPPEELQPGDIIVLGAPVELIVHRFWGLHRRDGAPGLLTKGDHLIHFDPSVPAAALIGRVIRRQREDRQLNLTDGIGRWLNQRLAGAYLDVFEREPLPPESPFWEMANVVLTPHAGDAVSDWELRFANFFADNLQRWQSGEPLLNGVDVGAGY